MSTSKVSGTFALPRIITLFASLLCALGSGTNYVYSGETVYGDTLYRALTQGNSICSTAWCSSSHQPHPPKCCRPGW
ncbi:hypothetical protein E1B28_005879 [Marasmius oreades]|uniref:Uncharacterized protein n=1 Tax=Marasmius oreades TaxID=181124 RepID=A0A9P7S4S8_9AGAR|nr:uncharacterized protein E1B28_005879 [Marasmius oreades]KAG7095092.1 hypothetical protein E1B28_005879 [Marasmius oreades]